MRSISLIIAQVDKLVNKLVSNLNYSTIKPPF